MNSIKMRALFCSVFNNQTKMANNKAEAATVMAVLIARFHARQATVPYGCRIHEINGSCPMIGIRSDIIQHTIRNDSVCLFLIINHC